MWPRLILWIAGFVALPVAKYVWESVLETPSYVNEIEKLNAKKTEQEKADREELERLRTANREAMESRKAVGVYGVRGQCCGGYGQDTHPGRPCD